MFGETDIRLNAAQSTWDSVRLFVAVSIRIKIRSRLVKVGDTIVFIERNVTIAKTFKHDKSARKESVLESIDETTNLRVSSKRYTTVDLLCFFVCNMRPCHQQSVRSNESLPRPATRRSGITSLRRNGRTSRCGRSNPRYVRNALPQCW